MKKQRGIFEKVPRSGIWWVRYTDAAGRYHREKAGTRSAARALYLKRKNEALEGRKLPEKLRRAPASFREIVNDALEYSRQNKAHAAYRADKWHKRIVLEWFGERSADGVSAQDIEVRLEGLAAQGRKPATLNRYRAFLSLIYRLAVRNGKAAVNPARMVRQRKENNSRVRFLTPEEEKNLRGKIRSLCPEREPEFTLALHTGMRRSEQYGLRWADVDILAGIITIRRTKQGGTRHIPIDREARTALETLHARSDGSGRVCHPYRRWFEAVRTAAGVADLHWHDLRHTFASRLVMSGTDIRTLLELLGDRTVSMAMRYAHLAPAHLKTAVDRMAENFPVGTDTTIAPAASTEAGQAPKSFPIN